MELGSEMLLGFWFGVVMAVMCLVCAMPDLLKGESDVRQEQGFTAESGARYHITMLTSQPATANAQTDDWQGHEPKFVLLSAARHYADQAGQSVAGCRCQRASLASIHPDPEPARSVLELDFMNLP